MFKRITCAAGLFLFLISGCASHKPRWTPESVALPATPPTALAAPGPLAQRAKPLEIPVSPEPGKPIALTRDGALLMALENNRAIEVARFSPRIGETFVPEARGAFDPVLLGTVSTGRSNVRQSMPTTSRSSSASTAGGASGAAQTGGTAPTTPTAGDLTLQLMSQIQQLLASAQQTVVAATPTPAFRKLTTDTTQGSLTVQEFAPTGTQVFLTGALSATETNLTDDDYQGSWILGVNQSLLRGAGTTVNLAALKQARNRAAQSVHAFRQTVLDVVRQVELGYWDLVLANELLKIREFAVTLADEQLERNQQLLAVGKAIEGDVVAAQAEKASRTVDLTDAQAAIRTQTLAMIELICPGAGERWKVSFEPVDPPEVVQVEMAPDASDELAMQYRPELAQARLDLANSDLDVLLRKNERLPRVDLTGSYGRTSAGGSKSGLTRYLESDDFDNYRIGLDVEVPLVNRAERARYRRAELTASQVDRSVANLELTIATQVRQAAVEVEREWRRTSATQEAVRSRTEQLRVAKGRNRAGKTTNLDLLLVQRDFIQSQIDEISSRIQYIEALTSLYAAEGTLLERRGIFLDLAEEGGTTH